MSLLVYPMKSTLRADESSEVEWTQLSLKTPVIIYGRVYLSIQ